MKTLQNEKGFAIAPILLAIALIGIIAGAIAVASRTATVGTADHTARMAAATVVQQMSNLKTGYDIMLSKALLPDQITWNRDPNTGIFHPSDGGTSEQIPPAEAFDSSTSNANRKYIYKVIGQDGVRGDAVVTIPGIGTDNRPDYVVILPGLKKAVCNQINKILRGSDDELVSNVNEGTWISGPVNLSGNNNFSGVAAACVKTTNSEAKYVYYTVLKEQ